MFVEQKFDRIHYPPNIGRHVLGRCFIREHDLVDMLECVNHGLRVVVHQQGRPDTIGATLGVLQNVCGGYNLADPGMSADDVLGFIEPAPAIHAFLNRQGDVDEILEWQIP